MWVDHVMLWWNVSDIGAGNARRRELFDTRQEGMIIIYNFSG
jgi:hypothetical protein